MAGEQHLTARVDVQGADKGAADFHKVADAQDRFTQKITEAAPPLDEFTTAQTKATAAVGDYAELGSRVNPMLGAFIASMEKGAKIAGDLATKNISLKGTFSALASGISKYSGVLGLLGAGGIAYAGVMALTSAINGLREAHAKLEEQQKRTLDYYTEQAEQLNEMVQQAYELSGTRREKWFTSEEVATARELLTVLRDILPAHLRDEAISNVVAGVGRWTQREIEEMSRAGETVEPAPVTVSERRLVLRVAGREGVVSEAVLVANLPVATVNNELRPLRLRRVAAGVNGLLLRSVNGRRPLVSFLLDGPAVIMLHHVDVFSWHAFSPCPPGQPTVGSSQVDYFDDRHCILVHQVVRCLVDEESEKWPKRTNKRFQAQI